MAESSVNAAASRKVELAIGGLDALSVPPCVAVQYLATILPGRFSPSSVLDIVACEPALAATILSLAQREAAGPVEQRHALSLVLDRLDGDAVRDRLLGLKVSAGFDIEFAQQEPALPARVDLIRHSLAVACCAKQIAERLVDAADPHLAYTAGLLHDIGKLALQDIMPRSLTAIAREAEVTAASLHSVEQRHLGTHHALLGRQLAQRWRLPEPVAQAIWLHHSDAIARLDDLPETRIARIIWAADHLARSLEIGQSGNFDPPLPLSDLARALGADTASLQEIRDALPQLVAGKAEPLALDMPQAAARYCDTIQSVAANLATRHSEVSEEARTLKTASTYLDFARAFLVNAGPSRTAVDLAADLAQRWQRFFQTGSVCLVLADAVGAESVEAVVVEALGHTHRVVLARPEGVSPIPRAIGERFAMLEAQDHLGWVAEQVAVEFDLGRTKLLPLLSDGRAVAALAFELNYPGDAALFAEKFEMAASMAGAVIAMTMAKERQADFSERLIQAMGHTGEGSEPKQADSPMAVLAEMAAGVAHELNNPLSVISGRAQLMAESEEHEAKKRDLTKIQENAREVSAVIDDLMSFAEPSAPKPAKTHIEQIVEEAVQLAGQKTGVEHINAQIQSAAEPRPVFVDSGQIVSALANILANAVESYSDAMGPIKIVVDPGQLAAHVQISDLGCGMAAQTLQKATHPFFSAKPAGRQRGMGLAYAARLIQLNGGSLTLASEPEKGTTATVTLPYE